MDYLAEIEENPHFLNKIVGITFWGRSGSYFLQSLFDNHSEVLSLPIRNWAFEFSKFDKIIDFARNTTIENTTLFIEKSFPFLFKENSNHEDFVNYINFNINRLGKNKNEVMGTDKVRFRKILNSYLNNIQKKNIDLDRSLLIKLLHIAYAKSQQRKISTKNPIIVFNIHNYLTSVINNLHNDFKNAKIITCIRFPEKTFDSAIKHTIDDNTGFYIKKFNDLFFYMLSSDMTPKFFPKTNMISIKFEDIHSHTEKTMKTLANWLDISWNTSLLSSTLDGLTWWFTKGGKDITGTNPKISEQNDKLSYLSFFDIYKIRYVFEKNYHEWDYSQKRTLYKPFTHFFILIIALLIPMKVHLFYLKKYIKNNYSNFKKKESNFFKFLFNVCFYFFKFFLKEHWQSFKLLLKYRKIKNHSYPLTQLLRINNDSKTK